MVFGSHAHGSIHSARVHVTILRSNPSQTMPGSIKLKLASIPVALSPCNFHQVQQKVSKGCAMLFKFILVLILKIRFESLNCLVDVSVRKFRLIEEQKALNFPLKLKTFREKSWEKARNVYSHQMLTELPHSSHLLLSFSSFLLLIFRLDFVILFSSSPSLSLAFRATL